MPGSVIGVHQLPVSVSAYSQTLSGIAAALNADNAAIVTTGYDVLPAWLAGVTLSSGDASIEQSVLSAAQSVLGSVSGQGSVLPAGLRAMVASLNAIISAGSATAAQVDQVGSAVAAAAQAVQVMLTNLPSAVQGNPDDPQSIDSLVSTAQTDLKPVVTDLMAQAHALSLVSQQMIGASPIILGSGGASNPPVKPPSQQKPAPSSGATIAAVLGSVAVIAGIGYGVYWVHNHPRERAA